MILKRKTHNAFKQLNLLLLLINLSLLLLRKVKQNGEIESRLAFERSLQGINCKRHCSGIIKCIYSVSNIRKIHRFSKRSFKFWSSGNIALQ